MRNYPKRPIIGLSPQVDYETGEYKIAFPYTDCLLKAGAIPMLLPFTENEEEIADLIDMCDGIVLTGGHDVDPVYYGEVKQEYCNAPEPPRDLLERFLVPAAVKSGKPILAICRGIQVLNVFCGGTLYQDIHAQGVTSKSHRQADTPKAHQVTAVEGTLAADIFGTAPIDVNTLHHQAVKDVGQGLRVAAYSDDGLIEALDIPNHPFAIGVQWHPEMLAAENEAQMELFHRFVAACKSQNDRSKK